MYMILTEQLHDFLPEKDMSTIANSIFFTTSVKKINKIITQNTYCSKLNQKIQLLRKRKLRSKTDKSIKKLFFNIVNNRIGCNKGTVQRR